jgi:SNF2 family DNA or RNA helicase
MIVTDESHLIKSEDSLTYKICSEMSDIPLRFALSGTPMGRNPIDLWSQFFMIDKGQTLGAHINLFREAYFTWKPNPWGGKYIFNDKYRDDLYKRIGNKSIFYSQEEVLDLPPKLVIPKYISFSPEMQEMYRDEIKLVIQRERNKKKIDRIEVENTFIKLRQICSGFYPFENDEEKRVVVKLSTNPKIDALTKWILNLPSTAKAIIFYEFTPSGDMIESFLKKQKIKYERLYAGTQDKIATKRRFIDDKDVKIFLVNSKSGGMSLNLQVANYVMFYELPLSNIIYTQAVDRVYRSGQTKTTYIYYLIAKKSVEEKILKYIEEGVDIIDAIIKHKETII